MALHKSLKTPFTPQVAEILKRIDGLFKLEDIDGAQAEVARAKGIDPKNMYIHAYYERLQILMADRKSKKDADVAHKKSEKEDKKNAQIEAGKKAETKVVEEKVELEEKVQGEVEMKVAAERKKWFEEEVKKKFEVEAIRRAVKTKEEQKPVQQPAPVHPPVKAPALKTHLAELEAYNKDLFIAWEHGVPDPAAASRLNGLRSSLQITSQEHQDLEASAQRESYMRAFKNLWASNGTPAAGASTITALHRAFAITPGKYDGLDLTLLQEIRIPKTRPQLVVIDDEAIMLEVTATFLNDQGFDVRPFTTSDEAFQFLSHTTPDLILADINLESSSMGGFAFFQKLQEIPRLSRLPFIFVSGLTDDVVIRTGKSLGADDYVTKPFVAETLVSIIKGKLRRYSELKSISVN